MTAVVYRIDSSDRIVDTGGSWDEFAAENGGLGTVTGRPLWDFVAGDDVRAIWSLMLRRARTSADPVRFLYRCDAPGLARVMQMELRSDTDGSVQFCSTLVRATAQRTFSGWWDTATSLETVTVCGWCARVLVGDTWTEPERAGELLGLAADAQPRLTHGVCDACSRELISAAGA